jgi:hypothetical protein
MRDMTRLSKCFGNTNVRWQVLDFAITDGVRYDAGADGSLHHIRITHVREEDDAGNICLYLQRDDGTLQLEGVIEKFDPQVLCFSAPQVDVAAAEEQQRAVCV